MLGTKILEGRKVVDPLEGGSVVGKTTIAGQEHQMAEELAGFGGGAVDGGHDDAAAVGEVLEGVEDLCLCVWGGGGVGNEKREKEEGGQSGNLMN